MEEQIIYLICIAGDTFFFTARDFLIFLLHGNGFSAEKISFSAGVPLTTFLCLQTFLAAWQIRMEGREGKSTILHSCRISQTEKSSVVKSTKEKVSFSVFKLGCCIIETLHVVVFCG